MAVPTRSAVIPAQFHVESGEPVIRVALGITAYLTQTDHWAQDGIQLAFDAFLASPAADRLRFYTTSVLTSWQPMGPGALKELRENLSSWRLVAGRPRHHFFFRVADEPNCPEVGFSYTEIDERRAQRSGVLELTLPQTHAPAELIELLKRLDQIGAVHCAVGGFAGRWSFLYPDLAFTQFYVWAHRYWCIDIQVPEEMAHRTPTSLPGSNWLTFLGEGWARRRELELDSFLRREWKHGVKTAQLSRGLLIQAGDRPILGDLNQLAYPEAYAEVARALRGVLPKDPPSFMGPFEREERTKRWLLRFVESEQWPPT
jgi:hypothetical protein